MRRARLAARRPAAPPAAGGGGGDASFPLLCWRCAVARLPVSVSGASRPLSLLCSAAVPSSVSSSIFSVTLEASCVEMVSRRSLAVELYTGLSNVPRWGLGRWRRPAARLAALAGAGHGAGCWREGEAGP